MQLVLPRDSPLAPLICFCSARENIRELGRVPAVSQTASGCGCDLPSGSGVISIPGLTDVGMLPLELFDEGKHHESVCHHMAIGSLCVTPSRLGMPNAFPLTP
eukprot:scaffold210468_cov47-Attheya_sp.AAC.1